MWNKCEINVKTWSKDMVGCRTSQRAEASEAMTDQGVADICKSHSASACSSVPCPACFTIFHQWHVLTCLDLLPDSCLLLHLLGVFEHFRTFFIVFLCTCSVSVDSGNRVCTDIHSSMLRKGLDEIICIHCWLDSVLNNSHSAPRLAPRFLWRWCSSLDHWGDKLWIQPNNNGHLLQRAILKYFFFYQGPEPNVWIPSFTSFLMFPNVS